MNWSDHELEKHQIAKVEAAPKSPDRAAEASKWRLFTGWFARLLRKAESLSEEYVRAKTATNDAQAQKTIEEAIAIKEKSEAEVADLRAKASSTAAQADLVKLQASEQFNKNLKAIFDAKDLPDAARALMFAKLVEGSPDLADRAKRVLESMRRLESEKGVRFLAAPAGDSNQDRSQGREAKA